MTLYFFPLNSSSSHINWSLKSNSATAYKSIRISVASLLEYPNKTNAETDWIKQRKSIQQHQFKPTAHGNCSKKTMYDFKKILILTFKHTLKCYLNLEPNRLLQNCIQFLLLLLLLFSVNLQTMDSLRRMLFGFECFESFAFVLFYAVYRFHSRI